MSEYARHSVAPAGEPVYAFNHNLTRDVVYSTIVRTRRAHEHARVAEMIEGVARGREEEFAELLAQHYQQYYLQANLARSRNARAPPGRARQSAALSDARGDRAAARHATAQAERFYSEALALPRSRETDEASDLVQRVDLLTRRGDARRWRCTSPTPGMTTTTRSNCGPPSRANERLASAWRGCPQWSYGSWRRGVRLYHPSCAAADAACRRVP